MVPSEMAVVLELVSFPPLLSPLFRQSTALLNRRSEASLDHLWIHAQSGGERADFHRTHLIFDSPSSHCVGISGGLSGDSSISTLFCSATTIVA